MHRTYRKTFEFKKTIEEAQSFCNQINKSYTYYMKKHHPAHFTLWSANDGSFDGFVCWYYA